MALRGTLETFSVPEVLRLLSNTRKTGMLAIEGDRGLGSVWLGEGSIISARSDHESTGDIDATLFDLLRFGSGEFSFEADATPDHPVSDDVDVEEALGRAEELLAEWRELESVVPTLLVGVRLARELQADSVTVTAEQWRALAAIGGGTSAAGLGQRLELGELDTCRRLRDLLEADLVELTDDPVEPVAEAPVAIDPTIEEAAVPSDAGDDMDDDDWGHDDGPRLVDHGLSHEEVESLSSNLAGFVASSIEDADPEVETSDGIDHDVDVVSMDDEPEFLANGHDIGSHADDPVDLDEAQPFDPARELAADLDGEMAVEESERDPEPASASVDSADEFLAQLTNLSPKAAAAIEATAEEAAGRSEDEPRDEREADPAPEGDEEINRNLLLKFLSSTKN